MEMSSNWDNLPDSVLIKIFLFLDLNDRRNASLCCKAWSRILNCPILWRSLNCHFNSESKFKIFKGKCCQGTKCLPVVRHCSSWLFELTVQAEKNLEFDDNFVPITTFFQSLAEVEDVVKLRKFVILLVDSSTHKINSSLKQDIILSSGKFLRRQNCLISFSCILTLPFIYIVLLIDAVASSSAKTLKILEILTFSQHVDRYPDTFHNSLCAFVNLRYLRIPFYTLDGNWLTALSVHCEYLRLLVISVVSLDTSSHATISRTIADDVWMKVTELLPELGVAFEFGTKLVSKGNFKKIMPATVPLIGINCSCTKLKRWILRSLRSFTDGIRALELNCSYHEPVVAELITSCPNLTVLKLVEVPSIVFINILMNLMKRKKSNLKHLSILFEELSADEVATITEKCKLLWKSQQCFVEIHLKSQNSDDYFQALTESFPVKLYPSILSDFKCLT